MNELNEEQRAAAASGDSAMVLAGPGAGKTKTLIARCLLELESGHEVNVITFTVSAAEEIQRRLKETQQSTHQLRHVGTLHSWALKYLRANGDMRELVEPVSLAELADDVAKRLRITITDKRVRELMNGASVDGVTERTYVQAVRAAMGENKLVSYDGLLTGAIHLLEDESADFGTGAVYLIDEVQDSSVYDLEIYTLLLKLGAKLWCVGDLQQAIYSFRHSTRADVWRWANYEELPVFKLPTNYRSSVAVIKCCNVINETFVPRLEGIARAGAPQGAVVFLAEASVPSMFARLAKRLQELKHSHEDWQPDHCAVLCRTNKECGAVRLFLESEGVSVKVREAEKFEIPSHLWAALGMYRQPESDWAAQRYLRIMGFDVQNQQAQAHKAQRPLSWLHYPALFAMDRTPEEWRNWMNFLQVPKDEQGWFFERVGAGWVNDTWDEIMLQLFERVQATETGTGVTIATVHMAKGREWPHVLMPFCDTTSYRDKNGVEEERVFFVGASRAILTLTFLCTHWREDEWKREPVAVQPCTALRRIIDASAKAAAAPVPTRKRLRIKK